MIDRSRSQQRRVYQAQIVQLLTLLRRIGPQTVPQLARRTSLDLNRYSLNQRLREAYQYGWADRWQQGDQVFWQVTDRRPPSAMPDIRLKPARRAKLPLKTARVKGLLTEEAAWRTQVLTEQAARQALRGRC